MLDISEVEHGQIVYHKKQGLGVVDKVYENHKIVVQFETKRLVFKQQFEKSLSDEPWEVLS